jgi:MFS-type transporter involved in bile tolerance (Atg22 family)
MVQFATQASFLVVVIAISLGLGLGTVETSQLSQGVSTLLCSLLFLIGWKLLPHVPAKHTLPEGRSLITIGFVQVYLTAKNINQQYSHGLRWFFLALILAESSTNAFIVVSVVYLDEHIGLSSGEIGIFFLITLIGSLPGAVLGARVTKRLDPNRSWQLCMLCFALWAAGGVVVIDATTKNVAFLWGAGVGAHLGWYYPTENLFFSMCLPKGQEAVRSVVGEKAGFEFEFLLTPVHRLFV